jgi:hypothetical protein
MEHNDIIILSSMQRSNTKSLLVYSSVVVCQVSVEKWDMTPYLERFPRAVKCQIYVNTPQKVKRFLVGRQFFVIFVVFLLAQITSFPGIDAVVYFLSCHI